MIEKAIAHIKNAAYDLLSASAELKLSAKDCGVHLSRTINDEAEEAKKLAASLRVTSWTNYLAQLAKRTKR